MLAAAQLPALRGRHLLRVSDLDAEELSTVLALASHLKRARTVDQLPLLRGRSLQMLFEKPSLRTRVSFEVAMTQLGGHALFAQGTDFLVGTREAPEDVARTLSRYVDAIVVRTHDHAPLERFAAAATVPVINALSALSHPCQALGDMLTIKERFDTLAGLRISFIGDARNNVAASLAEAAVLCGADVTFGCPPTHRPSEAFLGRLQMLGRPHNATARAFTSHLRAAREADVVYTDVWTSMGEEALTERNAAALLPYKVTPDVLKVAAPHAIFMHCLPAHRDEGFPAP
jgi:ornithine carbamoyltransferase